jgi:hypothetical protein
MATVILVANTVVTVLLTWMVLNHFQLVEYDPMDIAVSQFQRIVFYSQLDGSVRAPPETFMTVVSELPLHFRGFCSILLFYFAIVLFNFMDSF